MEDEKGVKCTRYDRAVCGSMRGKKNWDAREGVPKGEIGLPGCDPVGSFSLCALYTSAFRPWIDCALLSLPGVESGKKMREDDEPERRFGHLSSCPSSQGS